MLFSKLRTTVAAGILGIAVMAPNFASAASVAEIIARGSVKIGVLVGAPPYGSIDSTGNPVGYDADVATLIGDRKSVV